MRRVIINALQYKQNSSGIGVLLRELFGTYTRYSERAIRIVLPHDGPEFPAGENAQLLRIPWDHKQSLQRMFYQTFVLGQKCNDSILLTTDSKTPFFLPKSCVLIPLITDLAVYRIPEVYQRSRAIWWRIQYQYLRHRGGIFLAISEFTKNELVQVLGLPAEKIYVLPCACSNRFHRVEQAEELALIRKKYALSKPFILFVGNSNPRKNLLRLMHAFVMLKQETNLPHQLIIAGEQGWRFNRDQALTGLDCREDIRFIGFVPDADMPGVYSLADLFAFPTLYEGFGIPVLEAQRCGVPVLTSGNSSLPEVGGNGARYVDPYDEASICQGMKELLTDREKARQLVQAGEKNAKRFSWDASAKRLNEIIEKEFGV